MHIMKKLDQKPIKLRNKLNPSEFYWTWPSWNVEQIDGVDFLPVTKFDPSDNKTYQLYRIRKDSLEKVKNG
jgi:hypothetical protein